MTLADFAAAARGFRRMHGKSDRAEMTARDALALRRDLGWDDD
jgi:hypothetical protein